LRSAGLSERLRLDPLRHLRALAAACHAIADEERPGYDVKAGGRPLQVSLLGPVGAAPASPRQLTAAHLRQLVCVEGVATKVSTVKPKVVESVHYCPTTQKHLSRHYVDATDPHLGLRAIDATGQEMPDRYINITTSVYPTKDEDGNLLETEFGLSTFKDHQTITLQEMPEKAPMGQLPRSIELILDHDWVDKIKPGDRVQIVGVYRALASGATQGQHTSSGVFRTVVLVNHVQILGRDVSQVSFEQADIRNIRQLATRRDILSILGRSISPSIHGHDIIKQALALQLLSGVEKNLENGTHLRGDINILMVGDPSTAKSQLLRSAMSIAPLAVSTTGKGSSGVGLTAAVTSDPDTRERRLEAGAMVLADRGLVCVDEFDKMGENDRVAIHEAMEQQTVTIAKAGIHASLNARCSVLAAANPVYGQYDRSRRIQENIGLPDSLLSRFDLLFVVLDQMDPELDRRIATHVVRGHRTPATAHQEDDEEDDSDDDDAPATARSIWQRGANAATDDDDEDAWSGTEDPHARDALHLDFLRKYLHYAKTRIQPVLTESARDYIAARYAELRARQDDRTIPVTARSLETVIRLATAHAKARLSPTVLLPDCEAAMDILSFALYHEQPSTAVPMIRTVTPTADVADHSKRARMDDDDAAAIKRVRMLDPDDALAQQIWALLEQAGDELDQTALSQSLPEVGEQALAQALTELEQQGRLMVTQGVVYKT
jgi:DNA replication licensing factor MCM3